MVALARSNPLLNPMSANAESRGFGFCAGCPQGLGARRKHLSPKYFYDATGSELFERITEQPEYYPTRCEITHSAGSTAADIAELIPPNAAVVEFGSGSNKKARILLSVAPVLAAYVPVDISAEMLEQEAAALQLDFPRLNIHPVAADFTHSFDLPEEARSRAGTRRLFPRLDHRQFRAARSRRFPAQCSKNSRAQFHDDHRRRSDQTRRNPQCRL